MTDFVPPMLASVGRLDELGGEGWVHEFKWDGIRAIVLVRDGLTRMWSRNGNEVTAAYPELDLADVVPDDTMLDGEVVALDGAGVPSFSLLQQRMHVRDRGRAAQAAARVPATLMLFDVLRVAGEEVVDLPLEQRRARLEALDVDHPAVGLPPQGDDAATSMAVARQRGLEGIVSKRRTSTYRPGERSPDWRKVRIVHDQDCAVVGWRRGRQGRSGRLGALLVATYDDGAWHFAGSVGSGLRDVDVDTWQQHLDGLRRDAPVVVDPPSGDDLVWTEPAAVVRIRHREWTPDGRMRQPSYLGVRTDVGLTDTSRPSGTD